ncbi:MAG: DUF1361 domain-containing protein [Spirochaetales bacterium]|nr:DUF1361 domain-containing protein [Spirochaetales bacterium]
MISSVFLENIFSWMGINLILAVLPLLMSFFIFQRSLWEKHSATDVASIVFRTIHIFVMAVFFIFLPNAPYTITDLIHLIRQIRDYKYLIVDGGCTDSLGEVPPPCRIIGNGAILCSVKGIFSAFLQTANIMADGGFQDLLWLRDIGFFLAPAFKKPQCLLIADHGFGTKLSASAIVHILVNPVIEVSFEPFFLHKNALTSLRN